MNREALLKEAKALRDREQLLAEAKALRAAEAAAQAPAEAAEGPGLGERLLDGAVAVGQKIDSYTSAPVRAAAGALLDGDTIGAAGKAAYDNFGGDPSQVPTGNELMEKAGVSDEPLPGWMKPGPLKALTLAKPDLSAVDVGGAAADMALDASNLIPGELIGKGIAKSLSFAGKVTAKLPEKAFVKVAATLSGETEKAIETYGRRNKEINALIAKGGNDSNEIANIAKKELAASIQETRRGANARITQALEEASPDPSQPLSVLREKLEASKKRLNPKINKQEIADLDELAADLDAIDNGEGLATIGDLQALKSKFGEIASGSYTKDGQIFQRGTHFEGTAKDIARAAKELLDANGPKELKEANKVLSKLHYLEDRLNRNMLAPDKSYAALVAAGNEGNSTNRALLGQLGRLTGTDAVGKAENVAAAISFANPSMLPVDKTGKSFTRLATAVGLGAIGGPAGMIMGTVASPMALKAYINAGQIPVDLVKKLGRGVGKLNDVTIVKAFNALKSPEGRAMIEAYQTGSAQTLNNPDPALDSLMRERGQQFGVDVPEEITEPPQEIEVPKEMRMNIIREISNDPNLGSIAKARIANQLNRKGTLDPRSLQPAPPKPATSTELPKFLRSPGMEPY